MTQTRDSLLGFVIHLFESRVIYGQPTFVVKRRLTGEGRGGLPALEPSSQTSVIDTVTLFDTDNHFSSSQMANRPSCIRPGGRSGIRPPACVMPL